MNATLPPPQLHVTGQIASPRAFSLDDLRALPPAAHIDDVTQLGAKRPGSAVRLSSLLDAVQPNADVAFLTLHSDSDDFHASIPLAAVRESAVVIYRLGDEPLPVKQGGPFRFFIPDHHACKTHEIDECANVKFVDRIELTAERGHDNRPHDEASHAALHE